MHQSAQMRGVCWDTTPFDSTVRQEFDARRRRPPIHAERTLFNPAGTVQIHRLGSWGHSGWASGLNFLTSIFRNFRNHRISLYKRRFEPTLISLETISTTQFEYNFSTSGWSFVLRMKGKPRVCRAFATDFWNSRSPMLVLA